MELPGTPVTIAATGVAQVLTTTVAFAQSIKFRQHWNNTQNIYWGDSSLDVVSATPSGVAGWLPPASQYAPNPSEQVAPHGAYSLLPTLIYVAGTEGEIVLWSYVEG